MSKSRRNVTDKRHGKAYELIGKMGFTITYLTVEEWRQLGLKPLRRGTTAIVDMQVSGVPKAKKRKG